MRPLVVATLMLSTLSAACQQPSSTKPGFGWESVGTLHPNAKINVKVGKKSTKCRLDKDDADSLTCHEGSQTFVFQRTEILSVRHPHRGRSAMVGAIPGVILIVGGGIKGSTENCTGQLLCGIGAAVVQVAGILIGGIGAGIGAATDFTGSTVYKAPANKSASIPPAPPAVAATQE